MAQFERDIDRYEEASGETFPENLRIGVVLNSARLTTWELLKAEIDNVRLLCSRVISQWREEALLKHAGASLARTRLSSFQETCGETVIDLVRQMYVLDIHDTAVADGKEHLRRRM